MRVVAGTLGGRRLEVPDGQGTRPTSELVRGAIFNSLVSRGLVEGATVADLFAGSGALGIEAVSRGASHAVLVESDRAALRAIRANVAALGLAASVTVVGSDALDWVRAATVAVDVALVDPPYAFAGWPDILAGLGRLGAGVVVCESDRPVEAPGWDALSVKRHGGTVVSHLRPQGAT